MGPAALVWTLLLSLWPPAAAAGDRSRTPTPTPTSLRFGGPARSRGATTAHPGTYLPRKSRVTRVTVEDENDALVTADRLAGPAAAELLATVTGTSRSSSASTSEDEDGSLEEGFVINARKNKAGLERTSSTSSGKMTSSSSGRFAANIQEPEIRLSTSLPPATSGSTAGYVLSSEDLSQRSTPGSTPSGWPHSSPTAMPAPEDLRLILMPWGPWHCHCKSGTMSRTRAGKLHGLSGRLRVGALSQLRTEHRPCTYQQCPCDRLREECPLDSDLCPDSGCSSRTTTTSAMPPIHIRRRPSPVPPSPSPALAFWKRVKMDLEDIWNSLSSVFTEMEPVSVLLMSQSIPFLI
ncbi:protein MENT [Ctenodactylus gundi]